MKKSNLTILLLTSITLFLLISGISFADDTWNGSDTTSDASRTGDVGVGITNPSTKLHARGGDDSDGIFFIQSSESGSDGTLARLSSFSYINQDSAGSSYWTWGARYNGNNNTWVRTYTGALPLVSAQLNTSGDFIIKTDPNTSGDPSWQDRFIVNQNGNVGIGTTNPSAKLHVNNGILKVTSANDAYGGIFLQRQSVDSEHIQWTLSLRNDNEDFWLYAYDGVTYKPFIKCDWSNNYTIFNYGNVGIGTTTPDYKLDVLGTIRAEEVKVETGWSDFVFEEDYNLKSLDQVETYIKANKHLPDIPSAKQVEEEGLSMADMMAKQMQKIEELTLYVIEQNKKLESQNDMIAVLKKENEEIKQKLEKLVN